MFFGLRCPHQPGRASILGMAKRRRRRAKQVCKQSEFKEMVAQLRERVPVPRGYTVTFARVPRSRISGCCGETVKDGKTFTIGIADDLTLLEVKDTLVHEYAHVLSWRPYQHGDHDAGWGVAFAEVYSRYNAVT